MHASQQCDGQGDRRACGAGPVCVVEFQVKYLPVPVLVKYILLVLVISNYNLSILPVTGSCRYFNKFTGNTTAVVPVFFFNKFAGNTGGILQV